MPMPARHVRRLVLASVTALSVSFLVWIGAAQSSPVVPSSPPAPGAREQAVLAILREVDSDGRYARTFWDLRTVPVAQPGQLPRPEPRRIGFCGNSMTGRVDKTLLRTRIVRLFRAFDLK